MIVVGILGDIGSGKSFVSKLFKCPVFNADIEVNKIYRKNNNCYRKIKRRLPKYIKTFPINKVELSRAILANNNNLKKIVTVVHPIVRKKMNTFLKKNVKKLSKEVTKFTSNRSKILSESFKILRVVILNKNENLIQNIFSKAEDAYRNAESKIMIISQIPKFILESIGIITLVIFAIYLQNNNTYDQNNIILYFAVIAFAAQRSLPRINQIFTSWFNIRAMENNLKDVNELSRIKRKKKKNLKKKLYLKIKLN